MTPQPQVGAIVEKLIGLAERCEKAEGPDRELDRAIYQAVTGKCPHRHLTVVNGDADCLVEVCSDCREEEPGEFACRYSASIDAALTLVPDGEAWCVTANGKIEGQTVLPQAHVLSPASGFVSAATPALALCAAALRARAHQGKDHD